MKRLYKRISELSVVTIKRRSSSEKASFMMKRLEGMLICRFAMMFISKVEPSSFSCFSFSANCSRSMVEANRSR